MIRRLFLSLLLVWCLAAAIFGSASAADTSQSSCDHQQACPSDIGSHACGALSSCPQRNEPAVPDQEPIADPPGVPGGSEVPVDSPGGQAAHPPQAALDGLRRRAQAKLDASQQRLARAERNRAIAANRRLRFLKLASLRRARADRLRKRAASAQKRADAAEEQMVDERQGALEEVQARRAAHSTELLNWFGSRVSTFTLAMWLLLMASFAAAWRPMLGWLAFRQARGLDGVTYAKAVAVVAAALAGSAAAVSALSPTLNGALSAAAVPMIAAAIILIGLIMWRAATLKAGTSGVSAALADRHLAPGVAVVLTLVTGLGVGVIGLLAKEPAEQPVPPRTAALARLAQPDPTARPTTHVARLRREAERADRRARRAEAPIATAETMLGSSETP